MELERVMGIEPTFEAWEAPVLPLNYTRFSAAVLHLIDGSHVILRRHQTVKP